MIAAVITFSSNLRAIESQLWTNGGANWDPRLKDFSNAGYKNGSVAIPDENDWPVDVDVTQPPYNAVPNDGIDDSQAFIDAIADCADYHAVYVPNGEYTILQQIVPNRDHFVLRGEDMYQTVLHFPKYLNEIYIQEIGYGNPAYDDGSNGARHTGAPKGFFRIEGGTERSIENFTFKFREQRKSGHWEHKGASAIAYGDGVVDSWVRNIYVLNGDNTVMIGHGNRLSILNIIFDHYIGRPDIIGSGSVHRWVGHIGVSAHNTDDSLFHNIEFKGNYFHELDNNNVPDHSVFSNFSGTDVALHHHGGGSNHNLYTNASVGNGPGIASLHDTQNDETHWRIYGDVTLDVPTTTANMANGHVFVGYDADFDTLIDANTYWEKIDPALLEPQNIYLAQLQHPSVNKPLPEPAPPAPPSQFTGDVIRMNPVEDTNTDASDPDTVQDPSSKSLSPTNDMYFKFDLNGLNLTSIAKVRLRVATSKFENTPVELSVSSVGDDSWSDDTITHTNAQLLGPVTLLDTIEINQDSFAQVLEFDVTSFVQAEWAADKVVSLVINKVSGDGFLSGIRSSEMGIAPELIIEQLASSVPGAPSAPTGVKSYTLIGNVQLDWPDNPESDVATYNVYRSSVPGDISQYREPIAEGLITSDFIDIQHQHETGWDVGMMRYDQPYYYRVTAVDAHGYESESSLEIVGTAKSYTDDNLPPTFNADPFVLPNATQYLPYSASLVSSASDPEGDTLYFSKVDGPDWLSIAHDGSLSGTPRFGDTGMFQFTVQVNSLGSGRDETTVQITVNPGPPDAPLALDVVHGDASVQLDWEHDSEGSTNFTFSVYQSTVAGGPYTSIASGLSASDYTVLGLNNDTTYYYVVTASNSSGESANSDEVFATPTQGLVVGTNFIGGLLTDSVNWDSGLPVGQFGRVNVDASVDTSIALDGYSVLQTGGVLSSSGINGIELTNGSTWIMEGLNATISGNFRGFRVNSGSSVIIRSGTIDTANNRDWTVSGVGSSITINGGTINLGRDLQVTSSGSFTINGGVINGNPSSGEIGLPGHSSNGVYNFNGGTTTVAAISLAGSNSTFNFGGSSAGSLTANVFDGAFGSNSTINFLPGSQMSLTVSGEDEWAAAKWAAGDLTYNGDGVNELGSWAAVIAEDGLEPNVRFEYDSSTETLILANGALPPAAPQGLIVIPSDQANTLNWQLVNEPNVVGYTVYSSETTGGPYTVVEALGLVDQYIDTGLVNGTTYYYVVTATNVDSNESDYSQEESSIPVDAVAPAAPSVFTSAAGNGFVVLNWADSGEYDIASYTVYRSMTSNSGYEVRASGLTASEYVDSSALNDTTYYYKVSAFDTSGNESLWSIERSETPTAAAIVNTDFAGGDLNDPANWSFGSPNQSSIIGTITVGGTVDTLLTDFDITHTSGVISVLGSGAVGFSGGSYTLDGGAWDAGSNGFTAENGALITINSGTLTTGSTYISDISNSTFIVNGGTVSNDASGVRDMLIGGSTFTMNGGTMTIGGNLGNVSFQSPSVVNFNGGTFVASAFDFQVASVATLGGTTAGSVTVASSNGLTFDWLTGSQVSLTISGADEWAAAEWAAGNLTYNGLGTAELGIWAQVSAPGGLGNDLNFAYDSNTETLSIELTVWNFGTDFLGGDLATAGNWTNGLPMAPGNSGTITANGSIPPTSTVDYYVTQTAGTISNADFSGTQLNGGIWNLEGGTLTVRGLSLVAGSTTFNVSGSGTANLGNNNKDVSVNLGTSFSVSGGTVTLGRHLRAAGGVFTISGGTITGDVDTTFGTPSFQSNGTYNFNGGTTTAYQLDLSGSNTTFNFGGYSAGSLSVTGFASGFGNGSAINFLPGSLMSLTVSGVDEWAEAEWIAGNLTYNGDGTIELGSWASVTTPDGLGNGAHFAYDSNTETLTLVFVDLPPAAPQGLNASPGDETNALSWQLVNESDVTGYTVHRSETTGGPYTSVATLGLVDQYTDTGLVNGTTYFYVVTATDVGSNESPYSNEDSATPFEPNVSPVFASDPVVEANATEDFTYNGTLADDASDGNASDTLSFSKTGGPVWLTVASNGDLSGIPANGDVGLNSFTVQVSDGNGGSDSATLEITVLNVNDDPVFSTNPIAASDATEDTAYSGSIAGSASDVDVGDSLSYSKTGGPGWLVIVSNGNLSGTPVQTDVGLNSFTVEVLDGNGGTDSATLEITVVNTNDAPVFSSNPIVELDAIQDMAYSASLAGSATDEDVGDTLTYSKTSGDLAWLNVAANGDLTGTPGVGDVGPFTCTIEVSDGNGGTDTATLEITVLVPETIFLGGDIALVSNWNNGLPTSVGNPGTIALDGIIQPASTVNYFITQTAGTISNANFNGTELDGGEWNLEGGTFSVRGLTLLAGSTAYNVSGSGIADLGNNNKDVQLNSGTSFSVTGGTVNLGRDLKVNGGVFTISGGTITGDIDTSIGSYGFQSNGVLNFNGGTTTGFELLLQGSNTQVNFGGTTSGSLTVDSINGTNGVIDWAIDSLMSLTVSSSTTWAETEWSAGRLTYNGADYTTLGTWAAVTAEDGLGPDVRFDFNSATGTLSLGAGPPPNQAPVFNSAPVVEVSATANLAYSESLANNVSDPENDPLVFTKDAGPVWMSIATNGDLSGTPGIIDAGTQPNSFTVSVDDGNGNITVATLEITVNPDTTAPAAPSLQSADSGIGSVDLDWSDSSETDFDFYTVYRSDAGGPYNQISASLVVSEDTDSSVIDNTSYSYVVTATDTSGNESVFSNEVFALPGLVTDAPNSELPVLGTILGSTANVASSDDTYQALTEINNGTTSLLEHVWVFDVTGAEVVTFYVEAHHTANGEGDDFIFSYSTDDVTYIEMVTVTKTVDDDLAQYYTLPSGLSGTVYVRVHDADGSNGNTQLDTIFIDELVIESEESSSVPTAAAEPVPTDGALDVDVNADLSWTAGLYAASHDVYFGASPTPGFQGNQAGVVFDPGTLLEGTTYYWSVTEVNNTGTTAGPVWSFTTAAAGPRLTTDVVTGIDDSWQVVTLPATYTSPVVLATVVMDSIADLPMVARVRNVSGNSLELKVQNPSGTALTGTYAVHLMVVEEGVYTVAEHGIEMEALKVVSDGTNENNDWGNVEMEQVVPSNSYSSPVVLGQVMTENDTNWSVFWSCNGTRQNPATASAIYVGKHVGEDTVLTRANETLGVIILESGSGTLDGVNYSAAVGGDSIKGIDNSPPFNYSLSGLSSASVALLGVAGMDGADGGWPTLFGASPVSSTNLGLVFDEDQIGDSERGHTTEEVGYIVFE